MKSYEYTKIKGNLAIVLLLFFIVGGYAFFFSSTVWMPANFSAKLQTALNQNIEWAGRNIQIRRWDYCVASKTMEVELDISNQAFDGINNYTYSAISRSNSSLTVEPVIEESNWVVLRLYGCEENFGEISLRINSDLLETDFLKLYTNVNAVNKVDTLEKRDRNGYRNLRFEEDIKIYEEDIKYLEQEILQLTQKNEIIQSEIEKLRSDLIYQTEEQQQVTEQNIQNMQSNINSNNDTITSNHNKIEENQKRIDLLKTQIIN